MFGQFAQRSYLLERLDTGDYTVVEYEKWLREMSIINRTFGEVRALRNSLVKEVRTHGETNVSALEIGAGSGTLVRKVREWFAEPFVVGSDIDAGGARSIYRSSLDSGIQTVQCDGLDLPFDDSSFDYVYCSLVLHHLRDGDAVRMLREMSRVARKRIFAIDLNRSPIAYYFYQGVGRLLLQTFTRADGALSILRAFTPDEMRKLAEKAGISDIKVARSAAYRLVLSGK